MIRSLLLRCSSSTEGGVSSVASISKTAHRRANRKLGRKNFLDEYVVKDTAGQYEMLVHRQETQPYLKYADLKTLLIGCKTSEDIDYAIRALELFQKSFIEIHREGANLFTKKCVEVNAPEKALHVLTGPYRVHTFASPFTFEYIIKAFCESENKDAAVKAFDRMREINIDVLPVTLSHMMNLCLTLKDVEKLVEYVKFADEKKISVSSELWTNSMEFLRSNGHEELAEIEYTTTNSKPME